MPTMSLPVPAFALMGLASVLLDTTPDTGIVQDIGRLGITGILAAAVVVLWKKLQDKDEILMKQYKETTEALASARAVHEKMADTLTDIKDTVAKMNSVRAWMDALQNNQKYESKENDHGR